MGAFGADRCEHVTKTNLRRRPVPSFVSDEPRPRFSFRETSRNRNSALSAPCARVPSRGQPSRARFAMSDTHHRRPPTGVQPGIAPTVGRPMPRSAEASQKLWKSLQDVTSKVAPSVSSSLKEIGSSTKEVWLDPLREITRDIAGDVREAFRPGGASEAHASLRATAADARGATPRNVPASRVPAASASSRDAAGASGGFRGGIGWEPISPEPPPPSAGERLESIFAALEAGEGDTDLEAAERGAARKTRGARGVPNEIEEEPVPSGDGDADVGGSDATALLRDETADAFSRLGALRTKNGSRSDDDARELIGALMRRATATPGAAVALAAAAAALVVVFVARDHSLRAARMVDAGGVGGEPGGSEPAPETPPPPLPP